MRKFIVDMENDRMPEDGESVHILFIDKNCEVTMDEYVKGGLVRFPSRKEAHEVLYQWTQNTLGCYTPEGFSKVLDKLGYRKEK